MIDFQGIQSKLWVNDHWIRFRLIIGDHKNIITFLESNNILFLSELKLDFSTIPFELHGKGNSKNLLEYLSNNVDNNSLISKFLDYFLNKTLNIKYYENEENVNFVFSEDTDWQFFQIVVNPPKQITITTTTTTTTIPETTTTTTVPETTTTTTIPETTTTTTIPETTTTTTVPETTTTTTIPETTTTTTTILEILNQNLVALYNFEGNSGDSINERHGTDSNTIIVTGKIGIYAYKYQQAYSYFDWPISGFPFSIAFWVYIPSIPDYSFPGFELGDIVNSSSVYKGLNIYIDGTLNIGQINISYCNGFSSGSNGRYSWQTASGTFTQFDEWVYVTVTCDESIYIAPVVTINNIGVNINYVGGTADSLVFTNSKMYLNVKSLNNASPGIYSDNRLCYVDQLEFWNRILTTNEKSLLYNNGVGYDFNFNHFINTSNGKFQMIINIMSVTIDGSNIVVNDEIAIIDTKSVIRPLDTGVYISVEIPVTCACAKLTQIIDFNDENSYLTLIALHDDYSQNKGFTTYDKIDYRIWDHNNREITQNTCEFIVTYYDINTKLPLSGTTPVFYPYDTVYVKLEINTSNQPIINITTTTTTTISPTLGSLFIHIPNL